MSKKGGHNIFKYLFTPKVEYPKCYYFQNGKQSILIIDLSLYQEDIVFDSVISHLFKKKLNLFWFQTMDEMYDELEEYLNYTDEDCYVLIG